MREVGWLVGRQVGRMGIGNRMPAPIVLALAICTAPIELALVWPGACFSRASLRPSSVCSLSRKRIFHVRASQTASNEINACGTEKIIGKNANPKKIVFLSESDIP
jgi:hypothetical protein